MEARVVGAYTRAHLAGHRLVRTVRRIVGGPGLLYDRGMTNADKIVAILHERDLDGMQAAEKICQALGVDPNGDFQDPEVVVPS